MRIGTLLIFTCIFASCKQRATEEQNVPLVDEKLFPKSQSLDSINTTEFVTTLQHAGSNGRNIVYTPTFLYAWDKLGEKLGTIRVSHGNTDLQLIAASKTFSKALSKGEYETKVSIQGEVVDIVASFRKMLPFNERMDTLNMQFEKVLVKAFGMSYFNETTAEQIRIMYYENDDEFVIAITPKDTKHEIILAKGFNSNEPLERILDAVDKGIAAGDTVRRQKGLEWKYQLEDDDKVLIPVLKFNYSANIHSLSGEIIEAKDRQYRIKTATQKTAFVLDESGAKVESEAEVAVAAAAAPPPPGVEEIKHPKVLSLDKPFVVILRKQGEKNPYFMMKVENPAFMTNRALNYK